MKTIMTTVTRRLAVAAIGCSALAAAMTMPAKADWPEKSITIIAHFAPGGSNDLLARLIATELSPIIGQGVVVENRPGANGNIGVTTVSEAAPDGYTLLVASGSALVNPSIGPVSYDLMKDFEPIAYLGASPNVVLAGPTSGVKTLDELVAKAKAEPGSLNYASPGIGSTPHLAMELLKLRLGLDVAHIPYTGLGPALTAVLGGETELSSTTVAGVMENIRTGRLTPIVQTGKQRWPELPDVPTIEEAGVENAASETSQMLLAPAGTPPEILQRLAEEVLKIMQKQEVKDRMLAAGFAVNAEGPEELRKRMADEIQTWKEVAEKAGIRRE